MKIFFVGYHNPHFLSFCEYIERAITSLGHDLESYDYRDWLVPGRIRDRVPALHKWDMQRINNNLIRKVEKFRPDVLLVTGGWTISAETIIHLKKETNAVTVNWVADFPLMFDVYEKTGPHYDYFFASGTEALERYKRGGNTNGYWLPFACAPEIHQSVPLSEDESEELKSDICFVGSYYSERVEVLKYLTDFNLGIWGPGWDKLATQSPLRKFIRGGALQPQQWAKVLSASKIGLNIMGGQCDVAQPLVGEGESRMTNTRFFELFGCGALQMASARADAISLFKGGEHVCYFQDGKDLEELVWKYLSDPEGCKRIAQAGQKEALEKHTYKHRIKEMLSIVKG